ncbi:MAG: PaaI family thioesterase [Thermodesulfovibrionales bacterium]|nr:PaaI family thioesterase [Thermodesulfovibrionales bacterium]
MIILEDDGYCFACGPRNPSGLKLTFLSSAGEVSARFVPIKAHQGYKDIVHGGIITAVLDEAMAKAVIESGIYPVTAELTVRFKEPLMVGQEASVTARVDNTGGRLIEASASLVRVSDNKTIATSKAKMLKGS